MEGLSDYFLDYHLVLVMLGTVTNIAFIIINKINSDKGGVPLNGFKIGLLIVSYLVIGLFSYVFFYEDIQAGSNKVSVVIGLSSYYFIAKTITSLKKE